VGDSSFRLRLRRNAIDRLIILIMGLPVPLAWFRGGLLISYWDFDFPLSGTTRNFSDYIYVWSERFPPGSAVPQSLAQLPYHVMIVAAALVGMPIAVVETLILYLLFVGAGLSMHYLMNVLGATRFSSLIASAFYMFNSYVAVLIWANPTGEIFLYAFLPLVFALFMKGIRGGPLISQSLIFGISTLLLSTSFVTFTYAVVLWLFLGFFFVCYLLRKLLLSEKRAAFRACKFATCAIFTWCLINAWWLINFSYFLTVLGVSNSARAAVGISNLSQLQESSSHSTVLSVLGLQGVWAVYSGYAGDPYYSFSSVYSSLWLNALVLILPGIAFGALLIRRKSPLVAFFSLTAILAVFLAKGLNPPFESLYEKVFLAYPLLQPFREPYSKFGFLIVLSYAVLIGETLGYVVYRTIRRASRLHVRLPRIVGVGLVLFLVIGVLPWPLWTGDVVYPGGHVIPSARVSVPGYYQDANSWLASQPQDFRLYPWPFSALGYDAFNWSSGFVGADPSTWLLSKPVVTYVGSTFQLPLTIATELSSLVALNPGFEDGNLTGWQWAGQATLRPQGSSAFVQNQTVHGGNWAAEVSVTNTTIYVASAPVEYYPTSSGLSWVSRYAARTGQPLQIEAYLRADANITAAYLVFFFYDSEMRYVGQTNGPDLGGRFDWTYTNLSATVPSGVSYFIPSIVFTSRSGATGHGFADDVYFNGWPRITNIGSVLDLLNVKYLMIHDDSDTAYVQNNKFWVYAPNNELKSLLNSDKSMVLAAQFGGLTFYRNLEWRQSEVYAATSYQATSGNDTGLIQAAQVTANDTGTVVFASQETIQGIGLATLGNLNQDSTTSGLAYEKLLPTSYVVKVDSQGPFFLVFGESYDPGWSARADGLDILQHFVANGYANGWYVNHVGRLTITIEFLPQRMADIGAIVSVLTLILGVTILSRTRIKNSRFFKALMPKNGHRTLDAKKTSDYTLPDNRPDVRDHGS
jgi:hypothetical protein